MSRVTAVGRAPAGQAPARQAPTGQPSTLFDAPGPRARRTQRIFAAGIVTMALGLGWVVIARFAERGNLRAEKWTPFVDPVMWQEYLLPGMRGTLVAAALSVVLAVALGLLLGIGRLSTVAPIRWVCSLVVEFFRAVPVLVMMIFAFWSPLFKVIFPSAYISLAAVVTGLTLYNGAVIAELVRSGVENLPKGQSEAGASIGLRPSQTLHSILLPQAITAMLPALVSQLVVILKDSALGNIITYPELLNRAQQGGTYYANIVPALIVAAVLFILLNGALTNLAGRVERRLLRRGKTAAIVTDPTQVQADAPDPAHLQSHGRL